MAGPTSNGANATGGSQLVTSIFPDRNACIYTKCYCEENIWKLCKYIQQQKPELMCNCHVVFISNKKRQIPLWMQSSSKRTDKLVIWDYHVIFLHVTAHVTWVYDLDTDLSFPCPFKDYAARGLQDDRKLEQDFHRKFRVVPAEKYLQTFASDRSHMLSKDGQYIMPPPTYTCIQTPVSFNNIQSFISMDPEEGFGDVMDSADFVKTFSTLGQTLPPLS